MRPDAGRGARADGGVAPERERTPGSVPGGVAHEAHSVRVELPTHLRRLAQVEREVRLDVAGPVTQRSVLDALEARCPTLRGTVRDHVTKQRRPFIRFFACQEDLSQESADAPLPQAVASGQEPLLIIGAVAGG